MQHSRSITVATCNLNQWAMDFDGNLERVYQSCRQALAAGAKYRLGPELELTGYGCEDHFFELDTIHHAWESLVALMNRGNPHVSDTMVCDFGMPVLHNGVRYNCRVIVYQRQILLIRPKTALADDGNYRESRWFTAYTGGAKNETMILPAIWEKEFRQSTAPFGVMPVRFNDGLTLGCESCEELWTPAATHIGLGLQGVDIVGNGSGSHHQLRKLNDRLSLICSATSKCGGIYLYANQRGCDGGRLYFDGGALIVVNGRVVAQASQFSLKDVEIVTATVNLDEVRSYRASIPSLAVQSARHQHQNESQFVECPSRVLNNSPSPSQLLHSQLTPQLSSIHQHCPEEECCLGPACWLWDYLRRSGASGYFLPLSGGADSSSVALIVMAMCDMVTNEAKTNPQVALDCRRLCAKVDDPSWIPASRQEMASHLFHTCFMGTDHSSTATRSRAQRLAEAVGSYHTSISIDTMVKSIVDVFSAAFGRKPQFVAAGGTYTEDVALQNIQARLRMVLAYLLAQLLPWVRGRSSGFLLVLGSANVDEGLRGYMTKYDCSSADLNPIGAISKGDLKRMLNWASVRYEQPVLAEIANAPPTAELRPQEDKSGEHSQLDEEEMGMTYEELGHFGKLRKLSRCGPVSM